jgi:hypothetical protein
MYKDRACCIGSFRGPRRPKDLKDLGQAVPSVRSDDPKLVGK